MTRLAVATLALIALLGSFAFAQNPTPKVQVFGGYSLVHTDNGAVTGLTFDEDLIERNGPFGVASNFNGWNAEGQYNPSRWLGIVADFGGRYGTPLTAARYSNLSGIPKASWYSVSIGPVLTYRNKSKMTPYVHILFGYERASLSASTFSGVATPLSSVATTDTDAAVVLGGGLDYRLFRHVALRLAQFDDLHTTHNLNKFYGNAFPTGVFYDLPTHENNLRLSTGIVLNF